ncbi:MAG TPA: histidine phosphatase family protein [Streptosporangiaceae bacterium]|jgi:phosphohistidine phosphatase
MARERTLLVMRHAQAGGQPGVSDVQRPLTGGGQADAASAGRWLLSEGLIPGQVLCSTARRARQTWQQVSAALGAMAGQARVSFERRVYQAGAEDLLDLVRGCPGEVSVLLLVGHNPAVHRLASGLTERHDLGFPAGALAVVGLAGSWAGAAPGAGTLVKFWRPPGPVS